MLNLFWLEGRLGKERKFVIFEESPINNHINRKRSVRSFD